MISSTRPAPSPHPAGRAHSSWLALLAVGGTFAVFLAAQAAWSFATQDASGPDAQPVLAVPAQAPARLRCETCGVIEAIHRTEAADGLPAAWIFTVRLRDGSVRHSSGTMPGRWQVGDSMQLIGGARTWSAL